ncbi:MAG: SlyX family protein [Gammaproteobacteria bacterium]
MQDRITEIEIKLGYLEQAVNELSDVLYRQQNLIERLEAGFEQLRQRVDSSEGGGPSQGSEDEKPPHY